MDLIACTASLVSQRLARGGLRDAIRSDRALAAGPTARLHIHTSRPARIRRHTQLRRTYTRHSARQPTLKQAPDAANDSQRASCCAGRRRPAMGPPYEKSSSKSASNESSSAATVGRVSSWASTGSSILSEVLGAGVVFLFLATWAGTCFSMNSFKISVASLHRRAHCYSKTIH